MGLDHIKFYGTDAGGAMLAIASPYNGEAQHCGNGNMIAILGGSTEGADALYAKAIELGQLMKVLQVSGYHFFMVLMCAI
jgi:hypothetical protein